MHECSESVQGVPIVGGQDAEQGHCMYTTPRVCVFVCARKCAVGFSTSGFPSPGDSPKLEREDLLEMVQVIHAENYFFVTKVSVGPDRISLSTSGPFVRMIGKSIQSKNYSTTGASVAGSQILESTEIETLSIA